ncbi:non-heme iron oxygenase ferredoxin subunit [Sphingobium sp. DEHP117]|uniref:Rieske (2Fe-2S) protein n=1 Tax=Sphingobium sp. DEHP117 TaxID=2993436 RepID=UPI0027D4DE37|nr:Rieske 2Fe-2S domain-containing protein [Sphingobium sp. DEHP117]MDQ4420389.1 non-heme iron oxygenase ferredoxin subunit [Sphingobium sp. DEHP117]
MTAKTFVTVATIDQVPAGSKKVVEVAGTEIVLCHSKDRIFAVRNLCSHASEKLDGGQMKAGWIACPVHGARFRLETGEAMNPPAVRPIETYEVLIDGDEIQVAV